MGGAEPVVRVETKDGGSIEVRLDSLEGAYGRIEEKVDNLAERVESADWNGKGPVIRSLAELAPYLIALAETHKHQIDDDKALARVREIRAARWIDRRRRWHLDHAKGVIAWLTVTLPLVIGLIWASYQFISLLRRT